VLAQFSLLDKRARNNKGVLQAFSSPECDVEKSIAEIGPLGLVPAAERRMVGIGRSDDQHIGVRETRDEDSGIANRGPICGTVVTIMKIVFYWVYAIIRLFRPRS
jgi:hypothetical protein